MPTYTAFQRVQAMQKAGFPASSLGRGLAISLAELGESSNTERVFGDNGESVGVWQIHLVAHPDVTSACAADLDCSTRAAYRISNGGTNWNPWGAFTSGAYKNHQTYADSVLQQIVPGSSLGSQDNPAVGPIGPVRPRGPVTAPSDSGSSTVTDTSPSSSSSPLTGFQFPSLEFGPFKVSSEPLFKVGITLIALGFVFVGALRLVGVEAGPVKVGKE